MSEISGLTIRKAKSNDIDNIIELENQLFPHPWRRHFFEDELTHDIAHFFVAEDTPSFQLAGYIIFWIIEKEMELHKIAVSNVFRGKGIGKKLFRFMLETATQKHIEKIFLEVRKSNQIAIHLYESFQFRLLRTRSNYYNDPVEDALIYCLDTFFKR